MTDSTRPPRTFRTSLRAVAALLSAPVRAWCRRDRRVGHADPGAQIAAAVAELRELSAAAAFADRDPAVCYEAVIVHAAVTGALDRPPSAAVTPPALAARDALAHPGLGDKLADWLVSVAAARTTPGGVLVIGPDDPDGAYALTVAALINVGSPHLSVGWRALP